MNHIKLCKLFITFGLLAIATGCASVTRGSMDQLTVNSTPGNAKVEVYRTNAGFNAKEIKKNNVKNPDNPGGGPLIGTTPSTFSLARKGNYRVVISKDGYTSAEVEVGNRISGAGGAGMAGNVIAGGIIGMVVDSRTGATRDLTPNPIDVTLVEGTGVVKIALPKKKEKIKETEETGEPKGEVEADEE